jgi:hypothetical protein
MPIPCCMSMLRKEGLHEQHCTMPLQGIRAAVAGGHTDGSAAVLCIAQARHRRCWSAVP